MRINTGDSKEWRTDLYERTANTLEENKKTGAIDAACIHATQDVDAKAQATEYLAQHLPAAQLEEVANLLSTDEIEVSVSVESTISTSE